MYFASVEPAHATMAGDALAAFCFDASIEGSPPVTPLAETQGSLGSVPRMM